MTAAYDVRRLLVLACVTGLAATGCSFQGVNSLPLPGAVGQGSGAERYHVEIANVATLESNSPVMIDDVIVGSVGQMTVEDWHAVVEVSVEPGVVIPANAVASVGQTSLLGSMHLALNPPLGEQPQGRLEPGATLPLNDSSTYPTTEQTLSALSAVVNGGGLGRIGDVIHNANVALSGREGDVRDLLQRLDTFVGVLDQQRDNIVASMDSLNRLAATFAGQRDVLTRAMREIPPALDVLIAQRPRFTAALQRLGDFSDTATQLVNDTQADLVRNLENLGPALKSLADIGPDLDRAIAGALTFPYTQNFIDRAIRGDYLNLFAVVDFTIPRLKRTLFLGTRWGEEGASLVPAPGEPWYQNYTYDPVGAPIAMPPPAPDAPPPLPDAAALPPVSEPIVPVAPPPPGVGPPVTEVTGSSAPIFAGPYPAAVPGPAPEGGN